MPPRHPYPPARREAVSDDYHGTTIADPYRWLEDPASEETQAWVAAQNARARALIDARPDLGAIRERLSAIWNYPKFGVPYRRGGRTFFSLNDGLRNQVAVRTIQEVVSGERDLLMQTLTRDLDKVAREQLGVEVVDVRVKQIDLPEDVSESVYQRMNADREKEAREHRSQGQELAEGIRAAADREVTIIKANAYRDSELIRGEGDAELHRRAGHQRLQRGPDALAC